MKKVKRTDLEYDCPHCKKYVKPYVLEDIPAMPEARPPIPFRQRVECPACEGTWYVAS